MTLLPSINPKDTPLELPAEMQALIRHAIAEGDDIAAKYLDSLPTPYRLTAILIAYYWFM